ncbi:hypothetical protein VNO77_25259 [Canavalia gladiata]|uniref:Uncharacterized protein n=1 Tax=Canavalia gladiata TaxID=3824 RepID=A0AAN9L8C5_CANGL
MPFVHIQDMDLQVRVFLEIVAIGKRIPTSHENPTTPPRRHSHMESKCRWNKLGEKCLLIPNITYNNIYSSPRHCTYKMGRALEPRNTEEDFFIIWLVFHDALPTASLMYHIEISLLLQHASDATMPSKILHIVYEIVFKIALAIPSFMRSYPFFTHSISLHL